MASVINDPDGRRRIQFFGRDGRRRTIRLGKLSRQNADFCRMKVEDLAAAGITGGAAKDETSRWVAALEDSFYDKLAAAGLVPARASTTLSGWLTSYIEGKRAELKPR